MNPIIHKLDTINVDEMFIEDFIETILNTIIFHRALGPIHINYQKCAKLNQVTFMKCGDIKVDNDIQEFTKQVYEQNQKQGEIKINFLSQEKHGYWQIFSKQNHEKIIETWIIPFNINTNTNFEKTPQSEINEKFNQIKQNGVQTLQKAIMQIITIANSNIDHLDENYQNPDSKIVKYPYQLFWIGKAVESEN